MINGFDTHYKDLLEHPEPAGRAISAACAPASCAAGMLSTEPIARRAQVLMRTMTGYGMTEIGVGVTGSFLDSDEETRVTMSGWPLVGYEVKIIDPASGATQPPGEIGEICVRGYQVMQGYYKKPEETAQDDRRRRLAAHRRQRSAARRRLPALPRPLQGSAQGRRRERRPDRGRGPPARRSAHQPRRRRRRARSAPGRGAGRVRHRRKPARRAERATTSSPSAAAASPASRSRAASSSSTPSR